MRGFKIDFLIRIPFDFVIQYGIVTIFGRAVVGGLTSDAQNKQIPPPPKLRS